MGGSPVGSFGAGYRSSPAGVDGVGIGLNGSFDISQSDSRNRFYGATAQAWKFYLGGLAISLNGYIPVLQKERGVSSSSVNTQTTALGRATKRRVLVTKATHKFAYQYW